MDDPVMPPQPVPCRLLWAALVALSLMVATASAQPARQRPYDVDRWSPQWGARWALEAFAPIDRLLVWRSPIRVATVASPDLSSLAGYGQAQLLAIVAALDFGQPPAVSADPAAANFVVCAGPTYRTTNDFCDAVYLARYRNAWFGRGLSPAVPDPTPLSANENPPLLPRCAFFADSAGSIGAAFVSLSSLDDAHAVRTCLMQGLGLAFWKIEAFFRADYSTSENTYGLRNHEMSLLQAAYLADRAGCPNRRVDVACFEVWLDRLAAPPLPVR